jgi:peptidoglycan/LPS O-acetylase OafA/YrhL
MSDNWEAVPPRPSPPGAAAYDARDYQPALDGLRALSIIAVLLYHDESLIPGGYLGVDIFFVLSGFLITSLLFAEWRRAGQIDLRRFYLRRALRLFPALAVLLMVSGAFALAFPHAPQTPKIFRGLGYSLLYITNWANGTDPMLLGPLSHTWSLAVEEQFYLLWPILFIALLRLTKGRRSLTLAILGLALASAAWRAILFLSGTTFWRLYNGTDSRADSLLVGCVVAVAMMRLDLPRVIGGPRAARWLACAGGIALAGLMVSQPLQWSGYYLGWFFLVALAAAALVLGVLTNPDWVFTRVLSWGPLVWIGRLSYSLYLWHYPIYGFVKSERLGLDRTVVIVLRLLLAFVAAIGSYYLVERPFLSLKKRLGNRPRPEPLVASSNGPPVGVDPA